MKKALCILYEKFCEAGMVHGVDYAFVLNMHDEAQIELNDLSRLEFVKEACLESLREAGEFFKFRCPIDGEVKVGKNWSETH